MGRYTGKTCRLIFMLVITSVIFVVELVSGYVGNSIALLSDAFNMFSDMISLCVGITACRVSRKKTSSNNVYDFSRAEVVGALCNAVFLTALNFTILMEAIRRLASPQRIDDAQLVLIVGTLGLAVNIIGLIIFQDCCLMKKQESPIEDKEAGVLLHVMGDALASVVVVVAATIFYLLPLERNLPCNWQCYIDPSLTVIIVVIILSSAFPLIKETSKMLLQMVPKGIKIEGICEKLNEVPGVQSFHELHIWELSGGKNIATLHVKYSDSAAVHTASCQMREVFHSAGIHAVTIQSELCGTKGAVLTCSYPCVSKECESQMCCSQQANPYAGINGYAEVSTCPAEAYNSCSSRKAGETEINIVSNGKKDWCDEKQETSKHHGETSNGITFIFNRKISLAYSDRKMVKWNIFYVALELYGPTPCTQACAIFLHILNMLENPTNQQSPVWVASSTDYDPANTSSA
ncbi:calcium/manganese antiporter SLC30A10-like [Latimeria chalumnae]|uniref:calcium/manganese antiporter SLC30A10-like n=1 Tax=Latimeria chalumnae TaxID=7897 RepID=UPI00313A8570